MVCVSEPVADWVRGLGSAPRTRSTPSRTASTRGASARPPGGATSRLSRSGSWGRSSPGTAWRTWCAPSRSCMRRTRRTACSSSGTAPSEADRAADRRAGAGRGRRAHGCRGADGHPPAARPDGRRGGAVPAPGRLLLLAAQGLRVPRRRPSGGHQRRRHASGAARPAGRRRSSVSSTRRGRCTSWRLRCPGCGRTPRPGSACRRRAGRRWSSATTGGTCWTTSCTLREWAMSRRFPWGSRNDVPLIEDPGLPGAGLILSRANLEAWLTESLGRPCAVRLRRLRYKPGTSVVLGFDLITAARLDDVAVTEPWWPGRTPTTPRRRSRRPWSGSRRRRASPTTPAPTSSSRRRRATGRCRCCRAGRRRRHGPVPRPGAPGRAGPRPGPDPDRAAQPGPPLGGGPGARRGAGPAPAGLLVHRADDPGRRVLQVTGPHRGAHPAPGREVALVRRPRGHLDRG